MIGSYGMKKKLQLPPMGFAKAFAKKLHNATSSKGNADMFMRKDVYDHLVDANKKVAFTVTSEGSKDQLTKGQKT